MVSEFDHINCLDIFSFHFCAFVHEQYYITTVYISRVHPVFSSQKHILLFGISFHLAYVLITHRFPSSPKCRLALKPNPNSYSKGYYGGKATRARSWPTSPPSAKTTSTWSSTSNPPICLRGAYRHNLTFFNKAYNKIKSQCIKYKLKLNSLEEFQYNPFKTGICRKIKCSNYPNQI